MLTQVDSDGFSSTVLEGIIDYRKDPATAVGKANQWVITRRGQKLLRKPTCGWKFLDCWKDGTESYSVEVAEFTKAREISDEH